jgi:hypothetical protein
MSIPTASRVYGYNQAAWQGTNVCAFDDDEVKTSCARVDANGNFRIDRLWTGADYRFLFDTTTTEYDTIAFSWLGGNSLQTATKYLANGQTIPYPSIVSAVRITGNVSSHQPVNASFGYVSVKFHNAQGQVVQTVRPDDTGVYSSVALPPGSYVVSALDWGNSNPEVFSPGSFAFANATPISLTAGQSRANVNFNLLTSLSSSPQPLILGQGGFGQTLSVQTGSWDNGATLQIQWLRDGVAISGANSSTYLVGIADIGRPVSVSVRGALPGYITTTTTSSAITPAALAAKVPEFGATTSNSTGFSLQITNYDSAYSWSAVSSAGGTVSISNAGLVQVSGLGPGVGSSITVTTSRTGYSAGSATNSSGSSLAGSALVPEFGATTSNSTGFSLQITNFDSAFSWSAVSSAGGTVSISNAGLVQVSGLGPGVGSSITVTTSRTGYFGGTASSPLFAALPAAQSAISSEIQDPSRGNVVLLFEKLKQDSQVAKDLAAAVKLESEAKNASPFTILALSETQIGLLAPRVFAELPIYALRIFSSRQIATFSVKQFRAIPPNKIWALNPSAVRGISSMMLSKLSAQQLRGLTDSQVKAFSRSQLSMLNAKQLRALRG